MKMTKAGFPYLDDDLVGMTERHLQEVYDCEYVLRLNDESKSLVAHQVEMYKQSRDFSQSQFEKLMAECQRRDLGYEPRKSE